MRITAVEAHPVSIAARPELAIRSAAGEHRISRYVLVAVRAGAGLTGFGEASVMPQWSGETQESALAAIRGTLAPVLLGRALDEAPALPDAMGRALAGHPFTKAALEMALADLEAKRAGISVYQLLGGNERSPRQIPLKCSVGSYPAPQAAQIAESFAAKGIRAVKVKVGTGLSADVARVGAVRSALGRDFPVGVDANCGWSEDEARAALPHLERLGVNFIEQPLARGDLAGCALLRRLTAIPILLDESVWTARDAIAAIQAGACDLISIYPGKNAGMRRSLEIAQIAADAGLCCVIGSNLEWEIGSAAMLHLAAAVPNLAAAVQHDIIGPLYHGRRAGRPAIRFEDGCALVPEGTGLGVEIEPAILAGTASQ